MINFKKMTKAQASEFVSEIDNYSDAAFDDLKAQWEAFNVTGFDQEYEELRELIIDVYKQHSEGKEYEIDLNVGICLYEYLKPSKGFTLSMACDDDIWRYISCKVFPDITYMRYPKPAQDDIRINKKRFYLYTRRIWLKTLWWYVFLSWQGDKDKTMEVLEDFTTDTISDLIERTGGRGYRLLLYRQLMKAYSEVNNKSTDLFNRIQKQNLVNCRTVEPCLAQNEESGYIDSLFKQLSIGKENDKD